jgi:hypothetical protein
MNYETNRPSGRGNEGKPRFLVVANETIEGTMLQEVIGARAEGAERAEVLVVAPALNSRLRYWLSDEDEARRSADLRLTESLEHLRAAGIDAAGRIGEPDPVQAIADALHEYAADQIVIPTRRDGHAHWLVRDVVERARRRFTQPVVQVAVEQGENLALYPASSLKPRRPSAAESAVIPRAQEAGT